MKVGRRPHHSVFIVLDGYLAQEILPTLYRVKHSKFKRLVSQQSLTQLYDTLIFSTYSISTFV